MGPLGWFFLVLGLLGAGGLITSTVEYKLDYNLVDLLLDKFRSGEARIERAKARACAAIARIPKTAKTWFYRERAELEAQVKELIGKF
jgi:hypothetical protein